MSDILPAPRQDVVRRSIRWRDRHVTVNRYPEGGTYLNLYGSGFDVTLRLSHEEAAELAEALAASANPSGRAPA